MAAVQEKLDAAHTDLLSARKRHEDDLRQRNSRIEVMTHVLVTWFDWKVHYEVLPSCMYGEELLALEHVWSQTGFEILK